MMKTNQLDLAMQYNDEAIKLVESKKDLNEAETLYRKAIDIIKEILTESRKDDNLDCYGMICHNLANLLKKTDRKTEARLLYEEDLRIYKELLSNNSKNLEKYEDRFAESLYILANEMSWENEVESVKEYAEEALRIRRLLADQNRDKYISQVALSCSECALVMDKMRNYESAEKYFREAIGIEQELVKNDFEEYGGRLASDYHNMANILDFAGKKMEAIIFYRRASMLWQKLRKEYPGRFQHISERDFSYEEAVRVAKKIEKPGR